MAGKSKRIEVRLTAEHKHLIELAALVTGQSVTGFVVSSVLGRAKEMLDQEKRVASALKERAALNTLLKRPKRSVRRHG